MKAISGMILTLTGMFALWSSGLVWLLYTLYELFAKDGSFWSTIGVAIIGLIVQLIVGFVATITGAVLVDKSQGAL